MAKGQRQIAKVGVRSMFVEAVTQALREAENQQFIAGRGQDPTKARS